MKNFIIGIVVSVIVFGGVTFYKTSRAENTFVNSIPQVSSVNGYHHNNNHNRNYNNNNNNRNYGNHC